MAYFNKKRYIIDKEYHEAIKNGKNKEVTTKEWREKMDKWLEEYNFVRYMNKDYRNHLLILEYIRSKEKNEE